MLLLAKMTPQKELKQFKASQLLTEMVCFALNSVAAISRQTAITKKGENKLLKGGSQNILQQPAQKSNSGCFFISSSYATDSISEFTELSSDFFTYSAQCYSLNDNFIDHRTNSAIHNDTTTNPMIPKAAGQSSEKSKIQDFKISSKSVLPHIGGIQSPVYIFKSFVRLWLRARKQEKLEDKHSCICPGLLSVIPENMNELIGMVVKLPQDIFLIVSSIYFSHYEEQKTVKNRQSSTNKCIQVMRRFFINNNNYQSQSTTKAQTTQLMIIFIFNTIIIMYVNCALRYCMRSIPQKHKLLVPETLTKEPFEDYFLIKSKSYEFLVPRYTAFKEIYTHQPNSPSGILLRPAFHILPQSMSQFSKKQKIDALMKKLLAKYEHSYDKCKTPKEIFHLHRKIKTDIKNKLDSIGFPFGRHKYHFLFHSINQQRKNTTLLQYQKKGVHIKSLEATIYPKGQVWMPTSETYLQGYLRFLHTHSQDQISRIKNVMDLGCGCGVLSLLAKKIFRKAKFVGIDCNAAAVDTFNVATCDLGMKDIHAVKADITKQESLAECIQINQLPQKYQLILCNPPWLVAKPLPNDSVLTQGNYDNEALMLKSCLYLASKMLEDKQSRLILIYSDLSKLLGLLEASIEEISSAYNLIVHTVEETSFEPTFANKSPLNQFKNKAKIFTYKIGLA